MTSLRFLALLVLPLAVLGQDITNISSGETPASTSTGPRGTNSLAWTTPSGLPPGIPTPSITPGAISPSVVQCYIPVNAAQESTNEGIEENTSNLAALPTGIQCYKILSGGLLDSTPFTTIGIAAVTNTDVTDVPRSSADTSSADPTGGALSTSSTSSSSDLKVVLPAVLGSVLVACLLVVGLLWFRRNRNRTSTRRQSMRAWIHRPGGWTADGNMWGDRKEEPQNEIALHERQPSDV